MLPESTWEKSVMLAKAMEWEVEHKNFTDYCESRCVDAAGDVISLGQTNWTIQWQTPMFKPDMARFMEPDNLYDPANMALCLRCLNWARRRLPPQQKQQLKDWLIYRIRNDLIFFLDTQDDQEYILDYVLELMIEAGLVEVS